MNRGSNELEQNHVSAKCEREENLTGRYRIEPNKAIDCEGKVEAAETKWSKTLVSGRALAEHTKSKTKKEELAANENILELVNVRVKQKK